MFLQRTCCKIMFKDMSKPTQLPSKILHDNVKIVVKTQ